VTTSVRLLLPTKGDPRAALPPVAELEGRTHSLAAGESLLMKATVRRVHHAGVSADSVAILILLFVSFAIAVALGWTIRTWFGLAVFIIVCVGGMSWLASRCSAR
jgi:hypothetical protein